MKKLFVVLFIFLTAGVFAQRKYALVIGNGAYTNLARLANPVNDATDMAAALRKLGFEVEPVLNGSLSEMEGAVIRLKNRLSASKNSYGFFFYAGHGVQSGGVNYLIPVGADIPSENFLRERALSVQAMLGELNDAGNELNVVVLDACRDNPFGWGRSSGGRGLTVVSNQPADSIIVFATSAGSKASDGTGRNGLFTSQLLKNLALPGIEVKEVFNRTGADVAQVSNRQQVPAVYNQFFGTAYLGERPVVRPPSVFEAGTASVALGALEILTAAAGTVQIIGANVNQSVKLPAWGSLPIEKINAGSYRVVMRYDDGKIEEKTVEVGRAQNVKVEFSYRPAPVPTSPVRPSPAPTGRDYGERPVVFSLGASVGTSFSAPVFVGTVQGIVALSSRWFSFIPSFFELGMDIGLGSGDAGVGHFSLYPFAHYAVLFPDDEIGFYLGAGAGYMYTNYTFPEGKITGNIFAADFTTGFLFYIYGEGSGFTLSYTLRTDFSTVSNKLAVGYLFRFK